MPRWICLALRVLRSSDGSLSWIDGSGGGEIPSWVSHTYKDFVGMLYGPGFPCYFAIIAEKRGWLRYTYVAERETESPFSLVDTLSWFVNGTELIEGRNALVVFVERESGRLEDYESYFWRLLQFLHDHDPETWPSAIPTDTEDPKWSFCFAGKPWFINANAPLYKVRKSRFSPGKMTIIMQTMSNLEGIIGTGPMPDAVKRRIRGAVDRYDLVPSSPEHDNPADPTIREWKQYWIRETNDRRTDKCPLVITRRPVNRTG